MDAASSPPLATIIILSDGPVSCSPHFDLTTVLVVPESNMATVIATWRAMIQYCWFSIWDLVRCPKFLKQRDIGNFMSFCNHGPSILYFKFNQGNNTKNADF